MSNLQGAIALSRATRQRETIEEFEKRINDLEKRVKELEGRETPAAKLEGIDRSKLRSIFDDAEGRN